MSHSGRAVGVVLLATICSSLAAAGGGGRALFASSVAVNPISTTNPGSITLTWSVTFVPADDGTTFLGSACVHCVFDSATVFTSIVGVSAGVYTVTAIGGDQDASLYLSAGAGMTEGSPSDVSNTGTITFLASTVPHPVIAAVADPGQHGGPGTFIIITVTFSVPVSGFDPTTADLSLTPSGTSVFSVVAASNSMVNRLWTITLQPSSTADVTVYIPAAVCTNAADGTTANTASSDLIFYYQRQVGLIEIYSVIPDASVGNAPAVTVLSGNAPEANITAVLPVYKFAAGVTVTFVRSVDPQFVSSDMVGGIDMRLTLGSTSSTGGVNGLTG